MSSRASTTAPISSRQHLRLSDSAKQESLGSIGDSDGRRTARSSLRLHGRGTEQIEAAYPACCRYQGHSSMKACSTPCIARCRRCITRQPRFGAAAGHQADAAALRLLENSEGCNTALQLLHHPKLRGDLVSRPANDVLREAEKLSTPASRNCWSSRRTPRPTGST